MGSRQVVVLLIHACRGSGVEEGRLAVAPGCVAVQGIVEGGGDGCPCGFAL
jgi:hypothetical protein